MRSVRTPYGLVVAATLGLMAGCGGGDDLSGPPGAGTLEVTTTTSGSNPDGDGYAVSLDGAAGVTIPPAGSHRFSDIAPGDHQVELSGLAPNCHVEGENPRTVAVVEESGATVAFAVVCSDAPTTSSLIAFGSEGLADEAIFVVRPDGTGLQRLSPEGALDRQPVWSPDRQRILFASGDDLYMMNADGSGRVLMVEAQGVSDYRWSRDGRQIAFVSAVFDDIDILDELWVMQADGSGRLRLAINATAPTWSPDGARLAYVSSADFSDVHIRVINSDGSGDVRLTSDVALGGFEPAWSPDGSRIAFVSLADNDIYVISPDGTGALNLTNGAGDDDGPAWSPDGRRLAFNTTPPEQPLESEIAVMNADGSGRTSLTNRPGFDFSPDWSPDGTQLVYQQSGDLDSEIFVMNADGSGQLNVSNRPDTEESSADWSGDGQTATAVRQGQSRKLRQPAR